MRLEHCSAARRLGTGVHALIGGFILRGNDLTFDTQHSRQKEKRSSHAPSVRSIVPEVWEDPIKVMR